MPARARYDRWDDGEGYASGVLDVPVKARREGPREIPVSYTHLSAHGVLVTASNVKQPVTASLSKTVYAAAPVLEALEKREGATVVVDESALLELVGNSKALNIVLLTVAISQRDAQGNPLLDISLDEFKEAIRVCVKPKFVDMNLAAVDAVCKELGLQ